MNLAIGIRMQGFSKPGSAGVVTDTLFVNCYWAVPDRPTRIFAEGSKGIKIMGTTPRNIWFPDDVEFMSYYPDALYPAEMAVKKAFPFKRIGLVDLSPAETQVWWDAYNAAVASFPATHAVYQTQRESNFLRKREEISRRSVTLDRDALMPDGSILKTGAVIEKIEYKESIAVLEPQECADLMTGRVDESTLRQSKEFV